MQQRGESFGKVWKRKSKKSLLKNLYDNDGRSFKGTGQTAMTLIFHITPRSQWESAQIIGSYRGDTLDTEGFIHCSKLEQVVGVANRFYAEQTGLVLLSIEIARLQAELRYEAIDGDEFPHLYGALNLDAVVQVTDFEPTPAGFQLPPDLAKEE